MAVAHPERISQELAQSQSKWRLEGLDEGRVRSNTKFKCPPSPWVKSKILAGAARYVDTSRVLG